MKFQPALLGFTPGKSMLPNQLKISPPCIRDDSVDSLTLTRKYKSAGILLSKKANSLGIYGRYQTSQAVTGEPASANRLIVESTTLHMTLHMSTGLNIKIDMRRQPAVNSQKSVSLRIFGRLRPQTANSTRLRERQRWTNRGALLLLYATNQYDH